MAPSRGHREVLAGHVAAVRGGRDGDGGYSGTQCAVSDSGTGASGSRRRASSRPRAAERASAAAAPSRSPLTASREAGCAAIPCAAPRHWPRDRWDRAAWPGRGRTGLRRSCRAGRDSDCAAPDRFGRGSAPVSVPHVSSSTKPMRGSSSTATFDPKVSGEESHRATAWEKSAPWLPVRVPRATGSPRTRAAVVGARAVQQAMSIGFPIEPALCRTAGTRIGRSRDSFGPPRASSASRTLRALNPDVVFIAAG